MSTKSVPVDKQGTFQAVKSLEELLLLISSTKANDQAIVADSFSRLPKDYSGKSIVFADLTSLNKVLEHSKEDQVIKVETGITVEKLNSYLAESKQWWPVDAVSQSTTVLDVINSGEGGPLDHRFGGPRKLVLGMDVLLASGEVTKCGGKVVKNVTGYDMQKLFVGSHATLGIPVSAYLRLYAKPETEKTMAWLSVDAQTLSKLAVKIMRSGLPVSVLELIDSHTAYAIAEAAEDKQLQQMCSSVGVVLHRRQSMLLTRIHGHQSEVDEISKALTTIAKSVADNIDECEFDAAGSDALWTGMANVGAFINQPALELSLSFKQATKIISDWRAEHKFVLWQFRPGSYLLKIFAVDMKTLIELKGSLSAYLTQSPEPIIMAFGDDSLVRRLSYLNVDNTENKKLASAIKTKFDPDGVLNPLVSMF